jgi:hypothetical protein
MNNDSNDATFQCSCRVDGVTRVFTIAASQTLRPLYQGGMVVGDHLEWQFYCEELDLILIPDGDRFVALDDPQMTFTRVNQ